METRDRRKKLEPWDWAEHPAEFNTFVLDLTNYLHKKEDIVKIDDTINKKIDGLAKKKLGLDKGFNFNLYFEHSWRAADYLAWKSIFGEVEIRDIQEALEKEDFIKNHFGYKFAHYLAYYASKYIKDRLNAENNNNSDNKNDQDDSDQEMSGEGLEGEVENNNKNKSEALNSGVKLFARGIFYLGLPEIAWGISQLKDLIALEISDYAKDQSGMPDLKIEIKAEIAKIIARSEEFQQHITPELQIVIRDSLAGAQEIAGERPAWLQNKQLRRNKK